MSQKLDSLSKIIIATGQINYMAVSIDSVNEQIKFVPDKDGVHKEGIEARNEILSETVTRLSAIMEELGNFINNTDCICHIDTRVAAGPFEILIQGMDDCEKDYTDEEENDLSTTKNDVTKIIYANSHDCSEGLIINFENIPKVIDDLCQNLNGQNQS